MNYHNMFATWQLVLLSFAYIGLLFAIAHLGDKNRQKLSLQWQRIIYPLTLGVYCTSWSFLGTASQTSNNIFSHLPIYFGPILLFLLAWPFIQRLIRISLKLNLTSIADLLAARFGKSSKLAVLVTVVALIGTMPYIALQIKAIVYSFAQLQNTQVASTSEIGFVVSLVLAAFTILFGIRTLDVTERHPGVMLAIAFESLVKLIALLAVGLFACYGLFDSPSALWQQTKQQTDFTQLTQFDAQYFIAMTIIVMAAFLTLPRQFQVMVVEVKNIKATQWSRYSFPLYVAIFAVLAIPLGLAGKLLLNNQVPSDAYVLHLPWYGEQAWLTLLAFIGAISAASSMVIISAMALSTMLSNEVFFPLLFHRLKQHTSFNKFKFHLLAIRKMLATGVILLSYGVFLLASPDTLASLGQVAFGAMAQLAPALVLAFFWRKASLTGVYSGILVGFCLWLLISLLPQFDVNIFGFIGLSSTALTLMSLALNTTVIFVFSLLSRQSVQERMQLALFLEKPILAPHQSTQLKKINAKELQLLVARFVGDKVAEQSFQRFYQENDTQALSLTELKQGLLTHTEKTLAKVMGASSARLVLSSALEGRDLALDELATLMTEASSQKQAFSHSLLQHAIENASEGISVIDTELKLVAWNKKYIELFQYPEELVYVGCPVELLIKYNAERGLCGPGDITQQVSKRLAYLQQGSPHNSERVQPDGTVIRIQGNPLPNGGFVMLFSDITMYHQAEQVLKQANQDLETRVAQRTQALEQANSELANAHQQAERAHQNKSLYLKACSHDLVQPLEAAKLFSTALVEDKSLTVEQLEKMLHINQSLLIANDMLASLGELARIESGQMTANLKPVSIERLFASLKQEFSAIAQQQQVQLCFVRSSKWILSDAHLVHRILQNLISNAIRYASPGKIVVGVKKQQGKLALQVIDNGPGIPRDKQHTVFEQFTRLNNHSNNQAKGLGLGLSISQSFAKLLDHQLSLRSIEGKGSCFSLLANACAEPKRAVTNAKSQDILAGVTVLCVDNEAAILSGMQALLTTWQCQVLTATTPAQAKQICQQQGDEIDIILMDFQLDSDINGVELTQQLRALLGRELPAILITANCEQAVLDLAKTNNMAMLKKMIKPAQLRSLMSAKLTAVLQQNYLS